MAEDMVADLLVAVGLGMLIEIQVVIGIKLLLVLTKWFVSCVTKWVMRYCSVTIGLILLTKDQGNSLVGFRAMLPSLVTLLIAQRILNSLPYWLSLKLSVTIVGTLI